MEPKDQKRVSCTFKFSFLNRLLTLETHPSIILEDFRPSFAKLLDKQLVNMRLRYFLGNREIDPKKPLLEQNPPLELNIKLEINVRCEPIGA